MTPAQQQKIKQLKAEGYEPLEDSITLIGGSAIFVSPDGKQQVRVLSDGTIKQQGDGDE